MRKTSGTEKLLADYRLGKTIGEGAFSKVKIAFHRKTNQRVAIKVINKKKLEASYHKKNKEKKEKEIRDEMRRKERERKALEQGKRPPSKAPIVLSEAEREEQERQEKRSQEKEQEVLESMPGMFSRALSKEVRLLQILNHKNIIRLYQVIETQEDFYIVMQYAGGGEIIDHIARKERLSEEEARKYFRQMISAIDHCHLCGVLHRDLKLENILLSSDKNILISDFGLGRSFQSGNLCATFCGTPLYASPELVSGIKYLGPQADIWAMGVVLYAMVCGKPPFQADSMVDLYKRIKMLDFDFQDHCSNEFKDLIRHIFIKNTAYRITMEEMRQHPWVNIGYDEPPERLIPSDEQRRRVLEGADTVDNCKSISFDHNAIVYAFHEVAPDIAKQKQMEKFIEQRNQTSSINLEKDGKVEYGDTYPEPMQAVVRKDSMSLALHLVQSRPVSIHNSRMIPITSVSEGSVVPPRAPYKAHSGLGTRVFATVCENEPTSTHQNSTDACTDISASLLTAQSLSSSNVLASPFKTHIGIISRRHSAASFNPNEECTRSEGVTEQLRRTVSPQQQKLVDLTKKAAEAAVAAANAGPSNVPKRPTAVQSLMRRASLANNASNVSLSSVAWRKTHEPVNTPDGVRSIRGIFSLTATSATMDPKDMIAEVTRVLTMLNIMHCKQDNFLVVAMHTSVHEKIEVEIEIVKVWLLSIYGVRIRRLAGSTWLYKQVHSSISDRLNITP